MISLNKFKKALEFILRHSLDQAILVVLSAIIFSLIFYLQVATVPGNDAAFQRAILAWYDWPMMVIISVINGLFLTVELYIWRLRRTVNKSIALTGQSMAMVSLGTGSGLLASIFSTATCGLCISALFSFLGANAIVAISENRFYILAISVFILFFALSNSLKRFTSVCQACRIQI